ncbi:MAG: 30S ribosomal protein S12 methylthiotransferase RimO [Deltaproteobacteria bacterium]|jgi:tRNA-2-methylthio-N6-dimethylallyladenosine synthase/ribosomal protein S12 methylthiotransferase|nr:30S ribosomal protein S12 methylthiotransferase RimO [Deltaproteobacteria bacterium]
MKNLPLKIYPVSLGCPKNRVDTERFLGSLGLEARLVKRVGSAGLVFVNTCGFIDSAVRESIRTILELGAEIQSLPAGKRPLLAVAGCLVGRYGEKQLAKDLPEVDLWLPTKTLASWPFILRAFLEKKLKDCSGSAAAEKTAGNPARLSAHKGADRLLSTAPSYAWLKISEGCGRRCSFCVIPRIRGPLRSELPEQITREAVKILERGVSELVLIAQDLTAWGRDLPGAPSREHNLMRLLERLFPLAGLKRLRLMYLYPAGLTGTLLKFLSEAPSVFVPYFDVPLQHADAGILKAMGRPFAGSPFKVLERIRKYFLQAALRTSLITGFPGESASAFAVLRQFVTEAKFQNLGVFAFEPEEGSKAALMPGQVPERTRAERRDILMQIQAGISEALLLEQQGRELEILIDRPSAEWPGLFVGRAWFQAPEVDGVTYVSGENVQPGSLVKAVINETYTYDLNGLAV